MKVKTHQSFSIDYTELTLDEKELINFEPEIRSKIDQKNG